MKLAVLFSLLFLMAPGGTPGLVNLSGSTGGSSITATGGPVTTGKGSHLPGPIIWAGIVELQTGPHAAILNEDGALSYTSLLSFEGFTAQASISEGEILRISADIDGVTIQQKSTGRPPATVTAIAAFGHGYIDIATPGGASPIIPPGSIPPFNIAQGVDLPTASFEYEDTSGITRQGSVTGRGWSKKQIDSMYDSLDELLQASLARYPKKK